MNLNIEDGIMERYRKIIKGEVICKRGKKIRGGTLWEF